MRENTRKIATQLCISAAFLWIGVKYLLPLCLPFLLGAGLAIAAEPGTDVLHRRLKLSRSIAGAISVSVVFLLGGALLLLLLALLSRQAQRLGALLPQLEQSVQNGYDTLRSWLLALAQRLPGRTGAAATGVLNSLFSDGASLLTKAAIKIAALAGSLFGRIPNGLMWLLTSIISGYMIAPRLPQLRKWLSQKIAALRNGQMLPAAAEIRKALWGWVLAEAKLAMLAFVFLCSGFFLLRIENGFVWAALTTLVDAFPVLGVGTVLIPWSLVCLLQGHTARGIGLGALYGVIWLTRSILEPRLLGKGLGLDPLITLFAIYAGWKLFGFTGILLAPLLTLVITQLSKQLKIDS